MTKRLWQAEGRSVKGFTLLETLLVISVVTVLTAASVPMLLSASSSYQLSSAVLSLTGAIQTTRYQAIMHGYPYQLVMDPVSQTYQIENEPPGASSFTKLGDAVPWSTNKGIALSAVTSLQFSPGGMVTANSGSMILTVSNATTTDTITVSGVGDVTVSP
jgi:prepilin-type N-terminal cleavage/methylation domain-containing protein